MKPSHEKNFEPHSLSGAIRKSYHYFFILFLILAACSTTSDDLFVGKWSAVEYTVNDIDQLPYTKVTLDFTTDGTFLQTVTAHDVAREDTGIWEFNKSEGIFTMSYDRNDQVVLWNVMDQKKDSFQMNNQEYKGFYVEWTFERIN